MSVINTNYLALVSQNNLTKSQNALGSAIERLSSGLRINSAKDDAAGQAIANRFTSNIKGLTQAARNANDGISIAQTTEGALNEINNNLQRIRELTVQAQNGSNSASDIDSIQEEVNQRLEEINRVAEQTNFNGIEVLKSSSDETFSIQVGAKDNETIDIAIKGNGTWNKWDASGTVPSTAVNGEARQVAAKGFDVLSAAASTADIDTDSYNYAIAQFTTAESLANNDNTSLVSYNDDKSFAIIDTTSGSEVAYSASIDADGKVALGNKLSGTAAEAALASTDTIANNATGVSIAGGSSNALSTLDKALKAVDEQRSNLGAIQNRFQSTIANLNNTITNLSAARSRIEDADYAVEVSNMTRAQILQQAGTSVLAQANQVPQGVLSLLR
ncbi:FliC/FljB family flagellin [Advenella alkanexedens]|uniref:Flagellin n=1 Tax=Advenella alkanexedens TaxID=1481665 RepID=A0ABS6NR48_9BURK|nr:FliC/FljB family flagellin [Advenella alkanexedens]MBV4397676.1 FliC/FljB family flagellin [Advenella alkanexedens]